VSWNKRKRSEAALKGWDTRRRNVAYELTPEGSLEWLRLALGGSTTEYRHRDGYESSETSTAAKKLSKQNGSVNVLRE
jgi:hypothetical protein